MTVIARRDGWELEASADYRGSSWATFTLHGLTVTREQATAILYRGRARAGPCSASPVAFATGWILTLELTLDEAQAIGQGRDPLLVLIPSLYLRPLSVKELMAR